MDTKYIFENIRVLLLEGFSTDDLQELILYKEFRHLRQKLPQRASLEEFVNVIMIDFTEQLDNIGRFLDWASKKNPNAFQKYKPYYSESDLGIRIARILSQDNILRTQKRKTFSQQSFDKSVDSWTIANLKSDLHEQSEAVAEDAVSLSENDKSDFNDSSISLRVALRWKRNYVLFLQKLLDRWCRSEEDSGSVIGALSRNRKALIPLIARLKLPGSELLLPDEEEFPAKAGESLLGNGVPDYNIRDALLKAKEELLQKKGD